MPDEIVTPRSKIKKANPLVTGSFHYMLLFTTKFPSDTHLKSKLVSCVAFVFIHESYPCYYLSFNNEVLSEILISS